MSRIASPYPSVSRTASTTVPSGLFKKLITFVLLTLTATLRVVVPAAPRGAL